MIQPSSAQFAVKLPGALGAGGAELSWFRFQLRSSLTGEFGKAPEATDHSELRDDRHPL